MKTFNVQDVREHFVEELEAERFTTDKTGAKTIELIGANFIADEPAIFGTVNEEYVKAEIDWYISQSTNINDIWPDKDEPPAAWKYAANQYGEINSNYGLLIFSQKYNTQFTNAVHELVRNPDSRRAMMVYNRPSIWNEFSENGKSDFICTNAQTLYIRDGKMDMVVQMRSNDVVFGYKNDRAWAEHVLRLASTTYNGHQTDDTHRVDVGKIYWQVQNLHVYERHFGLVNGG